MRGGWWVWESVPVRLLGALRLLAELASVQSGFWVVRLPVGVWVPSLRLFPPLDLSAEQDLLIALMLNACKLTASGGLVRVFNVPKSRIRRLTYESIANLKSCKLVDINGLDKLVNSLINGRQQTFGGAVALILNALSELVNS